MTFDECGDNDVCIGDECVDDNVWSGDECDCIDGGDDDDVINFMAGLKC
jgi:hypothetical protein